MSPKKLTTAQRRSALKAVAQLEHRLGTVLFGWAARKHFAISAAKKKVTRIQREAEREVAKLQRSIDA